MADETSARATQTQLDTALFDAIVDYDNPEYAAAIRDLIARGANPNAVDALGVSALSWVQDKGVARDFIVAGANVDRAVSDLERDVVGTKRRLGERTSASKIKQPDADYFNAHNADIKSEIAGKEDMAAFLKAEKEAFAKDSKGFKDRPLPDDFSYEQSEVNRDQPGDNGLTFSIKELYKAATPKVPAIGTKFNDAPAESKEQIQVAKNLIASAFREKDGSDANTIDPETGKPVLYWVRDPGVAIALIGLGADFTDVRDQLKADIEENKKLWTKDEINKNKEAYKYDMHMNLLAEDMVKFYDKVEKGKIKVSKIETIETGVDAADASAPVQDKEEDANAVDDVGKVVENTPVNDANAAVDPNVAAQAMPNEADENGDMTGFLPGPKTAGGQANEQDAAFSNYGNEANGAVQNDTFDGLLRTELHVLADRSNPAEFGDAVTRAKEVIAEHPEYINAKSKDPYQVTAMMCAVNKGNSEMMTTLIQSGADLNAQNACGETSIMYAAYHGNVDMMQKMLENGADPMVVAGKGSNYEGMNMLQIMEANGHADKIPSVLGALQQVAQKEQAYRDALQGMTKIDDAAGYEPMATTTLGGLSGRINDRKTNAGPVAPSVPTSTNQPINRNWMKSGNTGK